MEQQLRASREARTPIKDLVSPEPPLPGGDAVEAYRKILTTLIDYADLWVARPPFLAVTHSHYLFERDQSDIRDTLENWSSYADNPGVERLREVILTGRHPLVRNMKCPAFGEYGSTHGVLQTPTH